MADFRIGTRIRSKISGDYGRVADLDPAYPNLLFVDLYEEGEKYPRLSTWLNKTEVTRLRKGSRKARKASVSQSITRDAERRKYGVGKYADNPIPTTSKAKTKQLRNFTGTVTRLANGAVIVRGIQR